MSHEVPPGALTLTFVCFPAGAKDDEFLKQFRRALNSSDVLEERGEGGGASREEGGGRHGAGYSQPYIQLCGILQGGGLPAN